MQSFGGVCLLSEHNVEIMFKISKKAENGGRIRQVERLKSEGPDREGKEQGNGQR